MIKRIVVDPYISWSDTISAAAAAAGDQDPFFRSKERVISVKFIYIYIYESQ
jgi:hypothetical protein